MTRFEASIDPIVRALLDDVDEDDRLSEVLGVDLRPPAPQPEHAPILYLPLPQWLERSEEVHRHLEATRRTEKARSGTR